MSDEEREALQVKDNKLTYALKNLYKEGTKVSMIFHLNMMESNLSLSLKTLEVS
jgi:hypothetical protein